MKQIIENIEGRECLIYAGCQPCALLIQPLGKHERERIDHEVQLIRDTIPIPFVLCAFTIDDWEAELTPWDEPLVSRRGPVPARAEETLHYVCDKLIPSLIHQYGKLPIALGGYSLAGLFSLWAGYERNCFDAVAGISPSVWIRGWKEYMTMHPICSKAVYLSLGNKEERSRNQTFAQVGSNIRLEHELLSKELGYEHCVLEWNEGNHFMDNELRTARGLTWCLEKSSHFC